MYFDIINNNKKNWILLLHCICSDNTLFNNYIDELSKKYNIIRMDLPGHGKSKQEQKFTLDSVCENINDILIANDIEKITIWGISLGAIVAERFSEKYENKVELMLLLGPAFGLKNKISRLAFSIFNYTSCILPDRLYITLFIRLVLYGKNRKKQIKWMCNNIKNLNTTSIEKWLKIINEYFKEDISIKINKSKIKRIFIIGNKDKVFKDYILNNIIEDETTKIIKIDGGHLCHLDYDLDIISLTNN